MRPPIEVAQNKSPALRGASLEHHQTGRICLPHRVKFEATKSPGCLVPTGAEETSIGHSGVRDTIVARVSLRVNGTVETRPRLQAAGWDDCFCFRAGNRASSLMTSSSGTGQKLE
jgi:hypothetical protein